MANSPLLQHVTQNPLLISATAEKLFQDCINHITGHAHSAELTADMASETSDDFWATDENDWRSVYRPYIINNGVLQIPVQGVLLNRFPYQFGRWATGYTYVRRALRRGLEDGNVNAIAFVIDSPGGEVAGCFECTDEIYAARGVKPMRSFLADHGYSAAFAIGSAPESIVISRSGGAGSVGVVTAHVDFSEAMAREGVKVTFIFAGKHKVDGNYYEKLPDEVKARIQKRIDKTYGVFVATVARNRDMGEDEVRATEALTYDAEDAIEVGFADKLGALEDEIVIFAEESAQAKDEQMAAGNEVKGVDQATHDKAVSDARAEGVTAGRAEGATAEKTRIKAILDSDEGKARPKAAFSAAMHSDMSLDAAKAFLGGLDEEAKVAKTDDTAKQPPAGQTSARSPFEKAMDASDNPGVGSLAKERENTDGAKTDEEQSDGILASLSAASGRKRTQKSA